MLTKLLERMGRKRIIFDDNENDVYLERYYLLWQERSKFMPFNILLHHLCRSDKDHFHDHPWNWASLILKGGYWENTPNGRFWRGVGSFRLRQATALHWLELDREKAGGETWSLFIIGTRFREWGFVSKDGQWVQWKTYLDMKRKA